MLVVPSEVDEHIQKNYPYIKNIRSKLTYQFRDKSNIEIANSNGYRDGKNILAQRRLVDKNFSE